MATRTGARAKAAPKKRPAVSSNVIALAGKGGGNKGGKKKGAVPNGSNTGEPVEKDIAGLQVVGAKDEEAFLLWQAKIRKQWKVVKKAKEVVASESGSLNELYGNAKESGIPASRIAVLKKLLKLEDRPASDVAAEHKEMAWQSSVTQSPLVQLGLFDLKEPTLEGYEMLGEKSGYEGQPIDNAPGKPSDDKHARWVTGWKRGQLKLSNETFNPQGKKGEGGGEDES